MFGKFEEAYLKVLKECDETSDVPVNECDNDNQIATEAVDENKVKVVSFRTSDQALIDALNNGFEEVVFFVKSVDDDGEETVEEVKFGSDSFDEFSIEDVPADPAEDEDVPADPAEDAPADPAEDGDDEFNEGVIGAGLGAAGGAALGAAIPVVGPVIGAAAGGAIGGSL